MSRLIGRDFTVRPVWRRITLRLMALENDLCAEWHRHVCFGPSDERKTAPTTKT